MKKPNLLIIGAQKCGTTWLHKAFSLSNHFYCSKPKELHYWEKIKKPYSLEEYYQNFSEAPSSAKYIIESTPNYFNTPNKLDIAKDIYENLGDIPLILLVRNPVDRYLSAYTHFMMVGRLPIVDEIETIDLTRTSLLKLGYYARHYQHFKKYFSDIKIYFHEDLVKDRELFIQSIFKDLNLNIDFELSELDFRVNDKHKKAKSINKKNNAEVIKKLPRLSDNVISELKSKYLEDIELLESITGRNLDHWK